MVLAGENTLYNACTYLIWNDKAGALVDCGECPSIMDFILTNDICISSVFLTHGHFDHIYGLNNLLDRFPDVMVYCSEYCKKGLADPKVNLSRYNEMNFVYKGKNIVTVKDGDIVKLGDDLSVVVMATPGHDSESLSFLIGQYLFTGDAFIPGIKTVTNLPGGNKCHAKNSVDKITNLLAQRDLTLCPGHKA